MLVNKTLTGQPAPNMANVSPQPAFIMAGDNDPQVLQGKKTFCQLLGMGTDRDGHWRDANYVLWRGFNFVERPEENYTRNQSKQGYM